MLRRTKLLFIVGALAIGALVNVLVSWRYALFDTYFVKINQITTPGTYPITPPAGYPMSPLVESASTTGTTTIECVPLLLQFRFGWPMRSLAWSTTMRPWHVSETSTWIETRYPDGSIQRIRARAAAQPPTAQEFGLLFDGLEIPNGTTVWIQRRVNRAFQPAARRLPIQPLPLGFAVNTVLYALPFLGISAIASSLLTRRQRKRRGLCVRCAYTLAGLAPGTKCPECGAA